MTHRPSSLAQLFAQEDRPRRYVSAADEISAVRRGDKAIAVYSFPQSAVENNDEDYAVIVGTALAEGLRVTMAHHPWSVPSHEQLYIFAYKEGAGWRIPAWLATMEILGEYAWSDGLEALTSAILGYAKEDIERWIAHQRDRELGWVGRTAYIWMSLDQRQRIVEHGCRSFPENLPTNSRLTWFVSRSRRPMRRDAAERSEPAHAIARVAICRDVFQTLFRDLMNASEVDVVSVELPAPQCISLNHALESRIEFLSADGWG